MTRPDTAQKTSPRRPPAAVAGDLRWLLEQSSTLIERLPPFQALALPVQPRQRQWLAQLESNTDLADGLPRPVARRLGVYFESLLAFYFRFAPDLPFHYRAQGVAIPAPEAPARTLGEMDFLLALPDGLMHLEVAVKFYLRPRGAGGGQWLGANPADTLTRKLERMRRHQLPVSGQSVLANEITERRFLVKGALFEHWLDARGLTDRDLALGIPADTPRHQWLYCGELETFLMQNRQAWRALEKLDWLGASAAQARSANPPVARPFAQMAAATVDGELRRVMVVPDTWPAPTR